MEGDGLLFPLRSEARADKDRRGFRMERAQFTTKARMFFRINRMRFTSARYCGLGPSAARRGREESESGVEAGSFEFRPRTALLSHTCAIILEPFPTLMSLETARKVLEIEARTLAELVDRLDQRFNQAVELLFACRGRVVVTGMGKSGLIGQKISATFSSTGTPSFFLHPAEALHGDLGRLVRNDALVALSYSGETEELLRLLDTVKRLAVPLITLTGNLSSTLGAASDVVIDVGIRQEACPLGLAPTASTTAMLAMGDALAMAVSEKRGFKEEDYAALHPGG